jgi:predicted TIM-barrel fold metal-dependent hydrolase
MNGAKRPTVIDADGHITEPPTLWSNYVEEAYRDRAPQGTLDEQGHPCMTLDGKLIMRHAMLLTLGPEYSVADYKPQAGGWDPAARLVHMDAEGIDVAVLFPSIGLYFSDISDGKLMAALCRGYNDWLADYCRHAPQRLVGIALLPLVDVGESIRELTRATEQLGFRGAFFRPNPYAGRAIHDPAYEPFWDCAASLGVPVTVHEGLSDSMPTLGRQRFSNAALLHVLSHPFEQMSACAGLILTGVLERHPALRVAFLESGSGWLPYWLERMDSHWDTWRGVLPPLGMKPSEYFRRQCVISTEPDDEVVDTVVTHVGDDYIIWASDYPHPDAHFPGAVTKTLESMASVSEDSRRKILATNAARLYSLSPAA